MTTELDPWYEENLVCPVEGVPLRYSNGALVSSGGREYPVVDGVPVFFFFFFEQTQDIASASLRRARGDAGVIDRRAPELFLESLGGIDDEQKESIVELARQRGQSIDPVVSHMLAATGGNTYKALAGRLTSYPIPELHVPDASGESFLDLGCNWGRWCIAAARKGYSAVGIDPSLGAVMAARRVAQELGLSNRYLVGDARFLPFRDSSFDTVFSYGVLQHMHWDNARRVLPEVSRVLKPGGTSLIQMPNFLGIRSLQNQVRTGGLRFRRAYQVRKGIMRKTKNTGINYWSVPELKRTFQAAIGPTAVFADCYFGLGLQKSELGHMPFRNKALIALSESIKMASRVLSVLVYLADSVYVKSRRCEVN